MSRTEFDTYREVASALTPAAVSQFLASRDWELELRQAKVREVWRYRSDGPLLRAPRVMIPLATEYVDFTPRFIDALESLAHIHDWDAGQLLEHVLATRADLFFVRLDQHMTDGTIPFRQAERTLHGIHKMMKASATTAADPNHPHKGRRPPAVGEFLDRAVRLGHTKQGSFVFTVVTRLGDAEESTITFPRRVMETLARGLETTRLLAQAGRHQSLASAGDSGLSVDLVESLEDLSAPDHLNSLDLSFEWAAAERKPDVGLATIMFGRDLIGEFPHIRERLIQRDEPARRETLVGLVKSLSRDDSMPSGDEAAVVTVVAEVDGKSLRVQVPLTGENHGWAIMSYERKIPFMVTGDLIYERRAWRLKGDIVVDSSFLRHISGYSAPDLGGA
ncbi:hypothetical protein GCM10018790_00600 [Kitasatospora xanthocidica]|uniref:hypothetical protein n=1 Tax=Kitasatospora xanthocidica TaxID=83382 RepID=UPI001673111C|nr:hypothetical protein [Kitasatospora xanthocidica]GHF27216.1 hypothetical protein GCM10018790_00600 [Kitasatospora xanthocidica]